MFFKNKNAFFMLIVVLTDYVVFLLSFVVAFYSRFYIFVDLFPVTNIYPFVQSLKYSLFAAFIWMFFSNFFIGFKVFYLSNFDLFIKILKSAISFIIILTAFIFCAKNDYSRMLIAFLFFDLIIFSFFFKNIIKKLMSYLIYKMNIRNNILIIGIKVRKYKNLFDKKYINKVFYYPYELNNENIKKLKSLSLKKNIKEIVVVNYSIKDDLVFALFDWAQTNDIDVKFIPNETDALKDKTTLDSVLGIPVMVLMYNPTKEFDYFFKRVIDVIISLFLLLILFPVFCILAIIIKLESKGPVFYKHLRIGYKQVPFYCYKFRSMYNDSDKQLQSLKENSLLKNDVFLKLENDKRITKVGAFIRKYSMDELPQLFNVLKGEMSLVGPRPIVRYELDQIRKNYPTYGYKQMFNALPGITGLWQVSGRSILSGEKRLELEIFYVNNWSLNFDFKILLKTIVVVFFHKGAY